MERSNQPSNTEWGREEGGLTGADLSFADVSRTTSRKQPQGTSQAASGSRTPLEQFSLETMQHAGGDAVELAEPNTEAADNGEDAGDLPGSENVAREERAGGNLGGPEESRRANYGSQSRRPVQRQEERDEAHPGVRSAHSSRKQGASPDSGQGVDTSTHRALHFHSLTHDTAHKRRTARMRRVQSMSPKRKPLTSPLRSP
jgi:hypothetical protein